MQTLRSLAVLVPLALLPSSSGDGRGEDDRLPRTKGIDALALHVWADEGWRPDHAWRLAAVLPAGTSRALLPLVSRSANVVRAKLDGSGFRLRLAAHEGGSASILALRVFALDHPTDHQLLLLGDVPHLVGPASLPYRAQSLAGGGEEPRDVLPELARQDLVAVAETTLLLEAPPEHDGLHWILVGRERAPNAGPLTLAGAGVGRFGLPCGQRRALALEASQRLELTVGDGGLDQVFLARITRLEPAAWRALELTSAHGVAIGILLEVLQHPEGPSRREAWFDRLASEPFASEVLAGGPGVGLAELNAVEVGVADGGELPGGLTRTLLVEVVGEAGPLTHGMCALRLPTPIAGEMKLPPPRSAGGLFVDVAGEAGLRMVHFEGPDEQLDIRPTMGPGAALGDFDGDGWVDGYLVQGAGREGSLAPRNRLFRNRGDGTFEDVSRASGTDHDGAGMGALFLDVDGDGDLDLYVANHGSDVLYENLGDGTFRDVSGAWGVGGDLWSAGVAAADVDGDGDLDLYVASYLDYDLEQLPSAQELAGLQREDPVEMLPFAFTGQRNVFLRNRVADAVDPARAFEDATDELGLADAQGRGMQPVFWDFDMDGDPDLYVANDVSPNVLWFNEGDGTFRDVSFQTGMDDPRGGMGVALGDVDGDGDEDLFLTNWELEANALYLNNLVMHREGRHRVATFRDGIVRAGLGPAGVGVTSWGCVLFDLDLDGDLDLFVANGYTSPDYQSTGICVGQPDHLFLNDGRGRFVDVSLRAGPAVAMPLASRAALAFDFDQDGDLDLLVTANNGPVRLLRNDAPRQGHWLGLRLRGRGANTHAIGARVVVRVGEREFLRVLGAGTSYLGGNAPELHFGLGSTPGPASVHVTWPSGATTTHALDVDRYATLRED